jgi:predicted DsbA family dithiol-disulfide isomerase
VNLAATAMVNDTDHIEVEWQRVELLAHCLMQGKEVSEELLHQLKVTQEQVEQLRAAKNPWHRLAVQDLSSLELDILACTLAPEAQPQIGWLYQHLQSGTSQPYASKALLHSLLALENHEISPLYGALLESSPLCQRGLVEVETNNPFQPIRPGKNVVARLLGWPIHDEAPLGSIRVQSQANWNDLILPDEHRLMLKEFILWIKHRPIVVDQWGGCETGGPIALFAGPSGTGKTFAASVVANTLTWPLYRVDLGRLISKYIGETEKNLNRLFDAAHHRPMVLQFDEADTLMSKRGEVKEARDRYANMEVSHLLARIEDHRGPCILTTNLRSHLDSAFFRRFQMVIEFPRPDKQARAQLWQRLLPPHAPKQPDISFEFLGEVVNLTGGNIRNAALHAAYLAAEEQCPISLQHIAIAVWRELAKDGRQITEADMRSLAKHLPQQIKPNHRS